MKRSVRSIAIVLVSFATSARAQEQNAPTCGASNRPWVKVTEGEASGVYESLRTELARRGLDVCAEGGPAPPIASVVIAGTGDSPVIDVEVSDAVTTKRVARDVDLSTIPTDGRALTIALAADELLRASWAELALASATPVASVPPPVQAIVDDSMRPALSKRAAPVGSIGVAIASEFFGGGQTQWGADARGAWFVTPRFSTTLRLGLRSAVAHSAPDGEVRASSILGGVGGSYLIAYGRKVGVDAFARLDGMSVSYVGTARTSSTAFSGSALTLLLTGGGDVWWSIVPAFRLTAGLGALAPLRPIRATDGGATVVAVSGIGLAGDLCAGGIF